MNNYFSPYTNTYNVERINRQIEELQNMKNQMQNQMQAPVQNFINSQPANNTNANMYELKTLNENDEVENIGIFTDTIFLGNNKMQIKKMDGAIEKYNIVKYYPIDPKDQKISQLEEEIKKLREMISNEYDEPIRTIQTSNEQAELSDINAKPKSKASNK